jgi:orotate phosphoribosyltransferase
MPREPEARATGAADAPSPAERRRLLAVIRDLSLRRGEFVLASGATSDYYLDLRLTTTHPEGASLSGRFLRHHAATLGATHVGGPTLGADPLVGAAVCASHETAWPLRGFLVRPAAKDHGTGRRLEGHLEPGARCLVLDDVVTSAGSLARTVEVVRGEGGEVVACWCLVDREGGGRERLAAEGLELHAVFQVGEVLAGEAGATGEDASPVPFRPRTPAVTVDAILELVPGRVLLIERKHPPLGWALPGGFVEEDESLERAVRREIEEETGLRIEKAEQMHTYSEPGRDPRLAVVTTVFVAVAHGAVAAADDAASARLFPLDALPENLCFDHRRILEDFREGRHGIGPGRLR